MLTDRAKDVFEAIGPWLQAAVFAFIAYALAQHLGWIDAGAITLAFGQTLRAHRLNGMPQKTDGGL